MKRIVNHQDKRQYLIGLTEDDFRQIVVERLFSKRGYHYADNCGPTEEGKDAILFSKNPFGDTFAAVIQTKCVKLNFGKVPSTNVSEAIAQLRTAASTNVAHLPTKQDYYPTEIYFICSRAISNNAKKHITAELKQFNIQIWDADTLIHKIDEFDPQLWGDIHPRLSPYLGALQNHLLSRSDVIALKPHDSIAGNEANPVHSTMYEEQTIERFVEIPNFSKGKELRGTKVTLETHPVRWLLSQEGSFLLTGGSGSGKSVLLRRLVLDLCEGTQTTQGPTRVPILLTASELRNNVHDILGAMRDAAAKHSDHNEPCFSQDDLDCGRVAVFVDSLDEVTRQDEAQKILESISEFAEKNNKCLFVVASRELMWLSQVGGIALRHYRLAEFGLKQAFSIVDKVNSGSQIDAHSTKEVLRHMHQVHGVTLNPLLVALFVSTPHIDSQDIPPNITQIFEKYTSYMLGQWDTTKGLSQQVEWKYKEKFLRVLAQKMHEARVIWISEPNYRSAIVEFLSLLKNNADPGKFGDEVLYRSGLLLTDGDRISFRHLALQEYFAGTFFETRDSALASNMHDEWWRHSIMFAFGIKGDRVSDLAVLAEQVYEQDATDALVSLTTIGIALQACYLSDFATRETLYLDIFQRYVRYFAEECLASIDSPRAFVGIIETFLSGKMALSTDLARCLLLAGPHNVALVDEATQPYETFWRMVISLETGCFDDLPQQLKSYRPTDFRLDALLYLTCAFISGVKQLSKVEKKRVNEIKALVAERVNVSRIHRELNGELLELRQGKMQVVDSPRLDDKNQYSLGI